MPSVASGSLSRYTHASAGHFHASELATTTMGGKADITSRG